MHKDIIIKIILLNMFIIFVNIFLYSNAFLNISISGGNAALTAFSITEIIMSGIIFFYGNYKLLHTPQQKMQRIEVKTLDDCTIALRQNMVKKTFSRDLETVLHQIKRFEKKKVTIKEILLQKFCHTEMSYQNFQDTIDSIERVIYLNIKSMLNRISAFDEEEYSHIKKSSIRGHNQLIQSKMDIYNEYISFVDNAVKGNEQIIYKLDKLLLEVSKFNSIEEGELESMDAMKEIDELIHNAKWYK